MNECITTAIDWAQGIGIQYTIGLLYYSILSTQYRSFRRRAQVNTTKSEGSSTQAGICGPTPEKVGVN